MIKVSGVATLKVEYTVELDMSEDEFDALREYQQIVEVGRALDRMEACSGAKSEYIEVWEVEELGGE